MYKATVIMRDKRYSADVTGFGLCVYQDNAGFRIGHIPTGMPLIHLVAPSRDAAIGAMFEIASFAQWWCIRDRKYLDSDGFVPKMDRTLKAAHSFGMRPATQYVP